MKYLITGGSGYIGSRLTELLVGREETERDRQPRRPPAGGPWPKTELRHAATSATARAIRDAARSASSPTRWSTSPSCSTRSATRRGCTTSTSTARGGARRRLRRRHRAGARHLLGDRLRRLARQPGPDRRGPAGARPARLRLRARQDRDRPHLPALGRRAPRPRDDDRPPASSSGPTSTTTSSAAGRTRPFMPIMDGVDAEFQLVHEDDVVTRAHRPARREGAGRLQPRRRRHDDAGASRPSSSASRRARCRSRPPTGSPTGRGSCACRTSRRRPGNLHFLRYPWIVSNEKLKATTGWEPTHTTRARRSRSRCAPRACMRSRRRRCGPTTAGRRLRRRPCYAERRGRLAQLGERQLDKLEVTGSSPVAPTSRKPRYGGVSSGRERSRSSSRRPSRGAPLQFRSVLGSCFCSRTSRE